MIIRIAKATKANTSKRTRLDSLHISKIALVGEGADSEARVVIAKSRKIAKDGDEPAEAKTFDELRAEDEARSAWNRARWTLEDSIRSILCLADPAEKAAKLKTTLEQFTAYTMETLPALAGQVSKSAALVLGPGGDALSFLLDVETLSKSAEFAATKQENTHMTFDRSAVKDAVVLAEIDRLVKVAKDATDALAGAEKRATDAENLAKAAKVLDPASPEAIAKAIETASPEMRPILSAMQTQIAKAEAQSKADREAAAAREEEIAKVAAKARRNEAIAKAKGYKLAGVTEEPLVELILNTPEAQRETLDAVLKSAAAIVKSSGAFREAGSSGAADIGGDPNAKLEALAKEKAKADGIPFSKALLLVTKDPANVEIATAALSGN